MAPAAAVPQSHVDVKVLHVMPSLARAYGGPVEALIGFVVAGQVSHAEVTVLGPRSTAHELSWLCEQMPGAQVVAAGPWGAGLWRGAPAVVSRLRDLLDATDVVHVHGLLNPISSGAARQAIARGRPVVIGPFGTLSRYTFAHRRSMAKRLYFRSVDAPNLRRAAALHFTTVAERDEAAWRGIPFDGRAHVVPPPYRGSAPRPQPPADAQGCTVLFLGRLHPVKGVDVLLDAWPAVLARRPNARLVIAGRGTAGYERALRAQAEALGPASESVTFVGFIQGDEKAACLAQATVCVLPSLHENFGIAVLDAAVAGVPSVVARGVQLAPWLEAHGLALAADRTAADVADAVLRIAADDTMRARVRACGAAVVAEEFGPSAIAPRLVAMYDAAMASGNGEAASARDRADAVR